MTASERARGLINAALSSYWNAGDRHFHFDHREKTEQAEKDRAALLAYVARLEAIATAARAVVDAELRTDLPYDEAWDELRNRLAALDRPEDGEHGDKD